MPVDYKIVQKGVLPIRQILGMAHYMRFGQSVKGLIDLYTHAGAIGKTGVEVGSFWGESAEIAAQFLGFLTCVDPWRVKKDEAVFDARMGRCAHCSKIRRLSHEAAKLFDDGGVHIVYIDGRHDYRNVKRDLLCWLPKIVPGGWIAGHDYDDRPKHAGVVQAVDEVLGAPELRFTDRSFLHQKTPELIARVRDLFPEGNTDTESP